MKTVYFLNENGDKQITIYDFADKMKDMCGDKAYRAQYNGHRLDEYFEESAIITEVNGKQNIEKYCSINTS